MGFLSYTIGTVVGNAITDKIRDSKKKKQQAAEQLKKQQIPTQQGGSGKLSQWHSEVRSARIDMSKKMGKMVTYKEAMKEASMRRKLRMS